MTKMKELLKVKELTVKYPGFKLDKVSFTCTAGEVLGIIGVNGAGKSTTIKGIMHMIEKQGGEICWKGDLITDKRVSTFREEVGYVGDNDCYYPNIKVKKILKIVSGLYSNWDMNTMEEYIEKFQLDVEKRMKELSTGMRVKLDLLMAMSHRADIYILDEPTAGLDPVVRGELLNVLSHLAKDEHKAVIISSHITSDLEKIASRIVYLVDGKIALDDKVENIRNWYIKIMRDGDLQPFDLRDCLDTEGGIIMTREIYEARSKKPDDFNVKPASLEEVLFYLGGY